MQVISTQLSYILKALFRDTSLAYSFCTSGGQVAGDTKKEAKIRYLPKMIFDAVIC